MTAPAPAAVQGWRCFPWDPSAKPGAPFSPSYLRPGQTAGRFDLADHPPVCYLAGSEAHAVGEILQGFRGATLTAAHLKRHGFQLALVAVEVPPAIVARLSDLDDPATLASLRLRPAQLAHHDRLVTQAIARQVHGAGHAGLRWWSALTGAWRSTVLFEDRAPMSALTLSSPTPLDLTTPALVEAARLLGIGIKASP